MTLEQSSPIPAKGVLMVALIFSPLLVSLTFAVCVFLPGLGIYYELKYRRERRSATRRAERPTRHTTK